MTVKLFEEIVLAIDVPGKKLKQGYVATVVEHHRGPLTRCRGFVRIRPF